MHRLSLNLIAKYFLQMEKQKSPFKDILGEVSMLSLLIKTKDRCKRIFAS